MGAFDDLIPAGKTSGTFDDLIPNKEGLWEGFVKPTLKATPKVIGATAGSMAIMPVAGLAGLAKTLTSGLNEGNKTYERIASLPQKLINTREEQQAMENIGLAMKPFQMAGEGWGKIGRVTGIPYAEPVLGTMGEASAMFGLPFSLKAGKARLENIKTFDQLRDVLKPTDQPAVKVAPRPVIEKPSVFEDLVPKKETPLEKAKPIFEDLVPKQETPKIAEPIADVPSVQTVTKRSEPLAVQEPPIITDAATVQEIKNSIAEGEMILKSGKKNSGKKMNDAELSAVARSVDNAKAKITPTTTQETKVIPTTKKAETNVVSPKEQKTYVLDKVDGLISEARKRWKDEYGSKHPDKEIDEKMLKGIFSDDTAKLRDLEPTIIIEVPNDGRYKIPNSLNALLNFQRKFKALKTNTEVPDIKSPMPSKKPTGKPLEQIEKEAFEEHQQYLNDKQLVKDEYNSAIKYLEGEKETYNKWKEIERKIDDKEIKPNLKRGRESYDISGWGVFSRDEIGVKIRELSSNIKSAETRVSKAKADIHQQYPSMYNEIFGKQSLQTSAEKSVSEIRSEALRELDKLRDTKPSSIQKRFGQKGPTPEQKTSYDAEVKEWNKKYRAATKKYNEADLAETNARSKGTDLSFMGTAQAHKAMQDISRATSQLIADTKMKPAIREGLKEGIDSMVEHDRSIRRAEFTAKEMEKVVADVIKDKERQMLMVHAYEQKMRGKYWDQLNEIEKGVVRWAATEKSKLNQFIKDNDILETMEDSSVNHIYHHWINPESGEPYQAMYGKFSKGLPQSKQRQIMSYESGIEKGLKPATTNIGKLIGLEWESATRANSARQLFKNLHGVKGDPDTSIILSKNGKPQPIRMIERWDLLSKQGLTDGYVRYDSPFLDKAITFESPDGRLVTIKGSVGVKEELYPYVRAYIENPNYGSLSNLNFATKSMKLGLSFFHIVSLGMQELANMRVPFAHIPKGLEIRRNMPPELKLLHQEGLELFKGYEDLGYQDKFFDNATKLGKAGNIATWPIQQMRSFIFDIVQPGMKISFGDWLFRKLLPDYLRDAGIKMTPEEVMAYYKAGKPVPDAVLQCAREVVQKVDGHFSGEHYKRSLLETNRFMVKAYFSPEARKAWQTALLSPTWQREHLLVAKNVAKSFMPDSMIQKLGLQPMGAIKKYYRRYLLGGLMIIGAVDLWNQMSTYMMDGESKHIWQNPKGKGFAVRAWWDEPSYTTEDKNGNKKKVKGGPSYIRPLKSLFEVAEWVHDPVLKSSYKVSPLVSAIGEQMFGMKKYEGVADIPARVWDSIIDTTTPIAVNQIIDVAEGKKAYQGAVTSFFGMPASKAIESQREKRALMRKTLRKDYEPEEKKPAYRDYININ